MGFMGVDEAKLALEFGKQLREVMEEKGDRLAAEAIDEEALADRLVAKVVEALYNNRVHLVGTVGGVAADLFLNLEPKEATS